MLALARRREVKKGWERRRHERNREKVTKRVKKGEGAEGAARADIQIYGNARPLGREVIDLGPSLSPSLFIVTHPAVIINIIPLIVILVAYSVVRTHSVRNRGSRARFRKSARETEKNFLNINFSLKCR